MSDDGFEIAPAEVPLSHKRTADDLAHTAHPQSRPKIHWRAPVSLGLLAVLAVGVLWWASEPKTSPASKSRTNVAKPAEPVASPGSVTASKQLPPFAQSQQALARERAQVALAKFVEQQIRLEEQMSVGEWGQAAFDQAMALAAEGDEHFVDERFEQAQGAYDQSTQLLAAVISDGQGLVTAALEEGALALDARDEQRAIAAFEQALAIDANSQAAQDGLRRAEQLPDINRLALQARNNELAGQWEAAVKDYQAILALDSATKGIAESLQKAEQAVGGDLLRQTLSDGFRALERRQYTQAKTAFNEALRLQPGNEIALGGLQQVSARTELSRIASLQRSAEQAVEREDWAAAVQAYESALKLDPNIQFAKAGIRGAKAQLRAANVLGGIVAQPNKLSSAQLLEDGRAQLSRARALQPQGPKLRALIEQSAALLKAYAQPVAVQLTSDNQTDVLVSTVGKLGAFSARELSLRPGEYVLLGSRNGCRDVRRTVIVAPGMGPVDIRCEEELGR
ncbi:MAG: hypothetical protein ACR2PZ_14810 [Pseudomonadales bacterium]